MQVINRHVLMLRGWLFLVTYMQSQVACQRLQVVSNLGCALVVLCSVAVYSSVSTAMNHAVCLCCMAVGTKGNYEPATITLRA